MRHRTEKQTRSTNGGSDWCVQERSCGWSLTWACSPRRGVLGAAPRRSRSAGTPSLVKGTGLRQQCEEDMCECTCVCTSVTFSSRVATLKTSSTTDPTARRAALDEWTSFQMVSLSTWGAAREHSSDVMSCGVTQKMLRQEAPLNCLVCVLFFWEESTDTILQKYLPTLVLAVLDVTDTKYLILRVFIIE